MKSSIAIIGTGHIGTALAFILQDKKIPIHFWDITMNDKTSFEKIADSASIIFLCVPSWANREIAKKIRALPSKKKRIAITLSKGMEAKSMLLMDAVLREELKKSADFGILVGPMLAKEIMEKKISVATLALSNNAWKKDCESLFSKTSLRLTFSRDTKGVALCSVLKNIYAVSLGMVDALDLGSNVKSYFTVQAYKEMKSILKTLGGKEETIETPAGLADFLATGWSGLSYNYRIGQDIAAKNEHCPRSEGCVALPSVRKLLKGNLNKFQILSALKKITIDNKDAKIIFSSLLKKI